MLLASSLTGSWVALGAAFLRLWGQNLLDADPEPALGMCQSHLVTEGTWRRCSAHGGLTPALLQEISCLL